MKTIAKCLVPMALVVFACGDDEELSSTTTEDDATDDDTDDEEDEDDDAEDGDSEEDAGTSDDSDDDSADDDEVDTDDDGADNVAESCELIVDAICDKAEECGFALGEDMCAGGLLCDLLLTTTCEDGLDEDADPELAAECAAALAEVECDDACSTGVDGFADILPDECDSFEDAVPSTDAEDADAGSDDAALICVDACVQ